MPDAVARGLSVRGRGLERDGPIVTISRRELGRGITDDSCVTHHPGLAVVVGPGPVKHTAVVLRVQLKRAWSDGTTHLLFEPVEFLEKLAALTPRPAINLILYHGVLAAHAR